MNVLQQFMEAVKQAITVMEIDNPNSDVLDLCYKALHDGEAELRREPDGWMNPMNSVVISKYQKTQVGVGDGYPKFSTPLYTREETK